MRMSPDESSPKSKHRKPDEVNECLRGERLPDLAVHLTPELPYTSGQGSDFVAENRSICCHIKCIQRDTFVQKPPLRIILNATTDLPKARVEKLDGGLPPARRRRGP